VQQTGNGDGHGTGRLLIDDSDVVVSAAGINRIKFPGFSQEVLYAKFLYCFGRRTRLDNVGNCRKTSPPLLKVKAQSSKFRECLYFLIYGILSTAYHKSGNIQKYIDGTLWQTPKLSHYTRYGLALQLGQCFDANIPASAHLLLPPSALPHAPPPLDTTVIRFNDLLGFPRFPRWSSDAPRRPYRRRISLTTQLLYQ
jgi:hypothetical protein